MEMFLWKGANIGSKMFNLTDAPDIELLESFLARSLDERRNCDLEEHQI